MHGILITSAGQSGLPREMLNQKIRKALVRKLRSRFRDLGLDRYARMPGGCQVDVRWVYLLPHTAVRAAARLAVLALEGSYDVYE
jgi:hypothetical protein